MKTLLAFLAIALCCSQLQAQNIEHQIVASQFGAFQVPTVGNGFAFPPDSCQVSGGGKNFPAFVVSVPIKIVDSNPAHTEVATPVAVNLNNNNCSVSMTTTYSHASFYLTSGTGGLQEALNAGQVTGGANTVILDQQWYAFVAPSNPATVIASVHGNTALGLMDVTTTPYTPYAWNGSTYLPVPTGGGANTPATANVLKGGGSANTVVAATPGTDYVIPSAIAGLAPLNSPTFTGAPQAPTQAISTNNTNIATTAAVNSVLGTYAPLASPTFTGAPKVPTASLGTNTTQAASTAYVLANSVPNVLTTPGDLILQGTSGPVRFPANSSATPGVLVSTAATSTVVPTTKTCAHESGASSSTSACTWSTAPVAGEALFCSVFNSANSTTFSIADSAGNTYTPYGSVHFSTSTSQYTQTFYTAPISSSVTTTTATASSGNFLAIQCNSANNIAASSPTDGQATVDATSSPITSTTITTTVGGDYIYCAAVAYFAETLSAGPGFTGGASANNNYLNQYATQGAAGPITPSMTGSSSNSASMTCSAFKAGAASTPATTAWAQSISLSNVQAIGVPVIPIPSTPSGGDDYATLQLAINTAIAENRELLIPAGEWQTSHTLVANTQTFRMRGAGLQFNVGANLTTYIIATAGVTTLSIGTGTVNSSAPGGYLRDIGLFGYGKPAVGSPTGVACLQVNGVVQFDVDSVDLGACDIGLDLTGNSYGSQFSNMSICQGANCNAAVNLRVGSQSGSDISFYNIWGVGAFCTYCIAGQGGGYHIINGQMGVNESGTPNDNAGCVVLTYDYLTGASTGQSDVDIHGTSMEGCQGGWVFRGYGAAFLTYEAGSMNPTSSGNPALGVYKNTNMSYGKAVFIGDRLSGYFSGANLLALSGSTLTGPYLTEVGTQSSAQNPTIDGVYTYVDSMTYQSGLSSVTNGSDQVGVESAGMWFGNNSGVPQYSTNHGSTWTNFYANPLTQLGQVLVGGPGGAATALNGNTTANAEVLVSPGTGGTPVAETYTCGGAASGVGNSQSCTWSTSPTAGMFVACGVTNAQGGATMAVTDSASNVYAGVGSQHTLWNSGDTQTFMFGPLTGTITTTTATSSNGNFLALKCQAAANVQPVTDGQCSVDITTGTSLPCSSAITTTVNQDYLFCAGISASGTLSHGTGFTLGSTDYGADSANQYQIQSTAGSITPAMTNSVSGDASMTCTAFKSQAAQALTFSNSPALSTVNMNGFSFNQKVYVDGFPTSGYTNGGAWSSSTTYAQFETVTYGGDDWISLVANNLNQTPAAASAGSTQYWMEFDTTGAGTVATQADAAFAYAWGLVQQNASAFTSYSGIDLIFGSKAGGYSKNGDWVLPTNSFGFSLSIHGSGRGQTWINQATSTKTYMISQPTVSSAAGSTIEGLTLNANILAGGCLSWHNRRSVIQDINCWLPQQQSGGSITSAMQFGTSGDAYELKVSHILVRTPTYSGLVGAYGTATVTAGAITAISWTGTGTNLNLPVTAGPGLVAYFMGKGANGTSYQPCGTMPVVSAIALTGGSINTGTGVGGFTFSNAGATCGGTIYVRVQAAGTIADGYSMGASDSTFDDLITAGDFTGACELSNHGFSTYTHEHPYCAAPYQLQLAGGGGSDIHIAPELDSPIQYGAYITGAGEIIKSYLAEYNAGNNYGAGDILIDSGATNFAIESSGCYSLSPQNFGGYAKFTGTAAGPINSTNAPSVLPVSGVIEGTQPNCDGSGTLWGTFAGGSPSNLASSSNAIIVDDFMSGGVTNDLVGSLGWGIGAAGGSGQTFAYSTSSSTTHPGVIQLTTGTTSGFGAQINLAAFAVSPGAVGNWSNQWITTLSTVSTIAWRQGFANTYPTGTTPPSTGIYFRYDTSLGTPDTTIKACVYQSSTETCANTGVTPVANTWHDYYIYSNVAGTIFFQIDNGTPVSICASGCTATATPPTGQMLAATWLVTQTAAAETEYVDYYKYVQTGINR